MAVVRPYKEIAMPAPIIVSGSGSVSAPAEGGTAFLEDFNWSELTDLSRGAPTGTAVGVPVSGYVGVINPGNQPRQDVFPVLSATAKEDAGATTNSRDMNTVTTGRGHQTVGELSAGYAYPNGVLINQGYGGSKPAYCAAFEGGNATASSQYWRQYIDEPYYSNGMTEFWAFIRIYWSSNFVWDNVTHKTGYFLATDTYDFRVPLFMAPVPGSAQNASGAYQEGRLVPNLYSSTGWYDVTRPTKTTPGDQYLGPNTGNTFNIDSTHKGKWIDWKIHVKQNTRGFDGAHNVYFNGGPPDGVFEVWWKESDQDDTNWVKTHNRTNVQWSPKDSVGTGINNYWHSYYWGGSGSELTEDMYLKIDKIGVYTSDFATPS